MPKVFGSRLTFFIPFASLLVAACGGDSGCISGPLCDDDGGGGAGGSVVVATVGVTSPTTSFASLGATAQLRATASSSIGAVISSVTFSWATSDQSVVSVAASGLATAAGNGTATITATADGTTGQGVNGAVILTVSQVGTSLVFVSEPSSPEVGVAFDPAVEVKLQDANGNAVLNSSVQISLTIGDNPTGGALSGTASVGTSAGVAAFSDLAITKRGDGYTLEAAAGSLMGESAAFDVGFNTAGTSVDVTSFSINGEGPEAVVAVDESLDVAISHQIWNGAGCPTCISQVIIGYGEVSVVCSYNGIPGVHPGASTAAGGPLNFPTGTGTFQIRARVTQGFDCSGGYDQYDGSPPSSEAAIGSLIVTNPDATTVGLSGISLNGGDDLIVVSGGANVDVALDYFIWNHPAGPTAIKQIVPGIDSDAQDCAYNGVPGVSPGLSSSSTTRLVAPTVPGTYEIHYHVESHFTCANAQIEYEANVPASFRTIGTIVVL